METLAEKITFSWKLRRVPLNLELSGHERLLQGVIRVSIGQEGGRRRGDLLGR